VPSNGVPQTAHADSTHFRRAEMFVLVETFYHGLSMHRVALGRSVIT